MSTIRSPHVVFLSLGVLLVAFLLTISLLQQKQKIGRIKAAGTTTATAVTTFQSIGLYWSPLDGSPSNQCNVQYRVQGTTTWKQALPLWYDTRSIGGRSPEYRGSIVLLQSGTTYEIQLTLASGTSTALTATTWSDTFPVARTVIVPSGNATYAITQGGTPTGYVLYTTAPGGTTITVPPTNSDAITVSAPYVIIRGLTIVGGVNGINVLSGGHDVVIENNDISGWGKTLSDGFGEEKDSAVFARGSSSIQRLIIQRNKMHDPSSNTNDWCESRTIYNESFHPDGPQAISLENIGGNHVIRYNDIYSSLNHAFNDGMGGQPQNAPPGFPNSDSDIYGNSLQMMMDDAIESEGAVMNVRIWGNYIDETWTGNATAVTAVGPLYTFRNIFDRDLKCPRENGGYGKTGEHGPFGKEGNDSASSMDGGRIYFFHNTMLQRDGGDGGNVGPSDYGNAPPKNMITRNNIWHGNSGAFALGTTSQNENDIDYDLMTSRPSAYSGAESHGIVGIPVFVTGEGDQNGSGGMYHLASNSPGYHAGVMLPDFNDDFGSNPDIGAQQSGSPKMEFGVNAYLSSPTPPTTTDTPVPTPPPGTTDTPVPSLLPTGSPVPSDTPTPQPAVLSL
ncbi:MAG TPA: hypothetical protein VGT05_03390, partial [Patescibacteria group bacterium]|nr:hypothetical protein [Patescibacteria group bacterium]